MSFYDWLMKDSGQNYIRVVIIAGCIAVALALILGVMMLFD
ncbi:hypothetical protein ACE2PP_004788 [Salmonella enterica]